MADLDRVPHRRRNALTGEWVLVSPHRLSRPWQGETFEATAATRPSYDPECYLCPGNLRAGGERNPRYDSTFVFDNDYPALLPGTVALQADDDALLVAESERGRCRVLCFSPRHDLDAGTMTSEAMRAVIDAWAQQYADLRSDGFAAVTIFENRGPMMGASNPHPHSQLWANATVPNEQAKEQVEFSRYDRKHGACVLCAYVRRELEVAERVVYENESVAVLVPFWAVWPFETLLVPREHCSTLGGLDAAGRNGAAQAIGEIVRRYDRLFGVPFPYSMGWHQEQHLHAHYYPPLLRSASVRKYLVGYEMLAQPQRDITAEQAARALRDA